MAAVSTIFYHKIQQTSSNTAAIINFYNLDHFALI